MLEPSILLASTFGKGVACWAAASLNGENNRTSLAIGALMNSRGLMELITTNLMASPVFEWV